MRFLILTTVFLLSHTVLANTPRRPFPHGQEDHAPSDEEDLKQESVDPEDTPALSERPCTLNFQLWLKRQTPPDPHPTRADGYRFQAQIMHQMGAFMEEWPGLMSAQCIGRSVRRAPIWSFSIENPTVEPRYTVLVFAQLLAPLAIQTGCAH